MPEKHRHKPVPAGEVLLKGALVQNPVLVQLIGICPVAAAAVSLRAGALLAAVSSLIIIATHIAASAFLKNVIRWVRVAVYLLIGLAFIAPADLLLEQYNPDLRGTLGIYLPLLAVNSLIALRCEKVAVRSSIKHSLLDSVAVSIGYSAVLLLTGFVRELLGSGLILEKPVKFLPPASGLLLPFGGFLVLGFMAAALKAVVMRHFPKYAKAMSVEISPTAVTMKLKPDADILPADPEPDAGEPVPAIEEPAAAPFVNEAGPGEDIPADTGTDESVKETTGEDDTSSDAQVMPEQMQREPAAAASEDMPEPLAAQESDMIETAVNEPEIPGTEEQSAPFSPPEPQPEDTQSAAMPASAPSAPSPEASEDAGAGFDLKLKELFDYLNELEKDTKDTQTK